MAKVFLNSFYIGSIEISSIEDIKEMENEGFTIVLM